MSDRAPRRERWTRIATEVWAAIGILILLAAAGYVLSTVFPALVPFLIGMLIVLLLRHPVEWLEKRGVNRTLAVVGCYLGGVAIFAILLTFIIPPIYTQIASFVAAVPGYAQRVYAMWDSYVVHPHGAQSIPAWLQQAALALRDQVIAGAGSWSSAIAQSAVSAGGAIASSVIGFVMALIIGFYTLVDLPRLRVEVRTLIAPAWRDESSHVAATVSRVLGGWLRGTLIQSTVVAVLFTLGLAIAGVPYALAIGVIGGVVNVVPYAGVVLTAVLGAAAGWSVSPWVALWAVVAVLVVNQFDSLIMAPRIIGDQVDLHPLLVIFAFLVGATLFGLPGVVLAVPVAAVIKGLFVYWFERRTERPLATEDGVLFRTPPPDESAPDATDGASDEK